MFTALSEGSWRSKSGMLSTCEQRAFKFVPQLKRDDDIERTSVRFKVFVPPIYAICLRPMACISTLSLLLPTTMLLPERKRRL